MKTEAELEFEKGMNGVISGSYLDKVYPISEIFTSPQGEGLNAGRLMTFIRLAGCSVGKPYTGEERAEFRQQGKELPVYAEKCCSALGSSFQCDTDFRVHRRMTVRDILTQVEAYSVCITGGEPFIHDLEPLIMGLQNGAALLVGRTGSVTARWLDTIQIETSGTITFPAWLREGAYTPQLWITVSPKNGCLADCIENANEIKLLVDKKSVFFLRQLLSGPVIPSSPQLALTKHPMIWIQPINNEYTVDAENLQQCLQLQKDFPYLRLSVQMHKYINVR